MCVTTVNADRGRERSERRERRERRTRVTIGGASSADTAVMQRLRFFGALASILLAPLTP
jgi:hypothetical protein